MATAAELRLPPPPTRWQSPEPCAHMAGCPGGAWQRKLKVPAMPLTKVQSRVLRVLAAERSPDSYIAGGVALNREGPRFSGDIDVFQDSEQRLESAAEADARALVAAGFRVSWRKLAAGKREAEVESPEELMRCSSPDFVCRRVINASISSARFTMTRDGPSCPSQSFCPGGVLLSGFLVVRRVPVLHGGGIGDAVCRRGLAGL